jgi:cytochrome c oxidase cbb3-type subunit 3
MQEGTRDPVTGQTTTGHDWNGIQELNTPVPRVVLFFLGLAFIFSVICWLLYPTFPLVSTYTKGLLGIDQRQQVTDQVNEAAADRSAWEGQILDKSFRRNPGRPGADAEGQGDGPHTFPRQLRGLPRGRRPAAAQVSRT